MPTINDALFNNNAEKLKKHFHRYEVRSARQDASPTEPDLEEGVKAAGDIDEDTASFE